MWAEMWKSSIRPSLECEEAAGQKAVFWGRLGELSREEGKAGGPGLHAADSFFIL